jgi:hypothetical protein
MACVCGLPSAAGGSSAAFSVGFRITAVSGPRFPLLLDVKVAAAGTLEFDQSPDSGASTAASLVRPGAKFVVERDSLSPHPHTDRFVMRIATATYSQVNSAQRVPIRQAISLGGSVLMSNSRSCSPGDTISLGAIKDVRRNVYLAHVTSDCIADVTVSGNASRRSRVQISFSPKCLAASAASANPLCGTPQPSQMTLTVNGTIAKATTASNSTHVTAPNVSPGSSLTIEGTLDEPLPAGWKFVVFHNGDPLSAGNGSYYTVCQITGPSGAGPTSCGDTRPTLPSPGDDYVGAQLTSPGGLVMYIQIYVPVRAP